MLELTAKPNTTILSTIIPGIILSLMDHLVVIIQLRLQVLVPEEMPISFLLQEVMGNGFFILKVVLLIVLTKKPAMSVMTDISNRVPLMMQTPNGISWQKIL